MKMLTFYSQKDMVEAVKEAKEAFATRFIDLGHMDQSENEYVVAYLFEKQGAEITPPEGSSLDNAPPELEAALRTIQKYSAMLAADAAAPIFTL